MEIEEDVQIPEPVMAIIDSDEEPEPQLSADLGAEPQLNADFDSGPGAEDFAEAREEDSYSDSPNEADRKTPKKRKKSGKPVKEHKLSAKEQMTKALHDHFNTLNGDVSGLTPAEFEMYETFNAQKAHDLAHGTGDHKDEESSEGSHPSDSSGDEEEVKKKKPTDYWGDPPADLLSRTCLEDSVDGSRAYIAHFVRFVMGAWNECVVMGRTIEGSGLSQGAVETFNSKVVVEKTRESLTPLLFHLQRNTVPLGLLQKLDNLLSLATERDYKTCMSRYVDITMGKKTWHQAFPQDMMQQNHGGSICKIIKTSAFVDFDYDPAVFAYVTALKRVIQFLQWLRPPTMPSMGQY